MPFKAKTHVPSFAKTCKQQAARDYNKYRRGEAYRLRNLGVYRKFRRMFLRANPLCCDPYNEHGIDKKIVLAEEVHHKRGLEKHPEDVCDDNQCAAVCTHCHMKLEQEERNKHA
jgi:hypothetical protein